MKYIFEKPKPNYNPFDYVKKDGTVPACTIIIKKPKLDIRVDVTDINVN